ncbi:MAG: hypothetical protein GWN87_17780 [Desulfuromonadales bacterium]|nr:hypothetical protein [Desulfuromonadales bacterium]
MKWWITSNSTHPPIRPLIHGDEKLIQQAILNILIYTLEAMEEGNTLSIHIWWKDKSPLCPQNECICASITDPSESLKIAIVGSGCALEPESMKRKFTPFFSSDRGEGLGLSISQRIVQEHAGHISYGCDPGSGSAFMVCLPTVQPVQEMG